ncbi:MAG: SIS domain-containing protein [Chloroflexota bacterium]|nr:MAG: SIS domain-containing protein [Chloroflexota bacterium]
MTDFIENYLSEVASIARDLDRAAIARVVDVLVESRATGGRLFILGVGGSAANASHAVNDFRKIAGIEAYAPTDNVSELTARINDEGWDGSLAAWLRGSRVRADDALLVLSVGGGDVERKVSVNLVRAIECAKAAGARVCAIVGRGNGFAAGAADAAVVIPCPNPAHRTPHSEAFQSVVQHLIVSHPALKAAPTKWESTGA